MLEEALSKVLNALRSGEPKIVSPESRTDIVLIPQGMSAAPAEQYIGKHQQRPDRVDTISCFKTTAGFLAYCDRFRQTNSALFFDGKRLNCSIDYHQPVESGALATWDKHQAILEFEKHPRLLKWIAGDYAWKPHRQMINHLDRLLKDLISPPAGEMKDLLREFRVKRDVSFGSVVHTRGNRLDFTFTTADKPGGQLQLPEEFTIAVPLLKEDGNTELTVGLDYKIAEDGLQLRYEIFDLDEILQDRIDTDAADIARHLDLPLFY